MTKKKASTPKKRDKTQSPDNMLTVRITIEAEDHKHDPYYVDRYVVRIPAVTTRANVFGGLIIPDTRGDFRRYVEACLKVLPKH